MAAGGKQRGGTGRDERGQFAPGNSGRPKGARNKTTLRVEALLDDRADALTQAAIDKALEGDTVALRLCLDRIAPARKDAPVAFDLPPMASARDAAQAAQAILAAVADGDITPGEGAAVMALVEAYRRTLETSEIEARIEALEGAR